MRRRVGIAENNKQEWQLREREREREVRKRCRTDCEREKRKKGEIITHRATCKTKIPPRCTRAHRLQSDTTATEAGETNIS